MCLFTSNPIEAIRITPPKHIVPSTIVVGRVPTHKSWWIGTMAATGPWDRKPSAHMVK